MEILVCTFRKTVGCTFMEIDISALLDLAATGCRGYADGIRWWIARRNTRYTRCCWCCNLSGIQSWYWQQLWTIGQGTRKVLFVDGYFQIDFTKTPQSPQDPTSTGRFGSELVKASSADSSSCLKIFSTPVSNVLTFNALCAICELTFCALSISWVHLLFLLKQTRSWTNLFSFPI